MGREEKAVHRRAGRAGAVACGVRQLPDIDIPAFRASPDVASWIKPADTPQTFRTTGQKQDVTLLPLNRLFDRRYAVYWQVT